MKIICHRANIENSVLPENHPDKIPFCLEQGFGVEVDLSTGYGDEYYLGHNNPQFKVNLPNLDKENIFVHIKDSEVMSNFIYADSFAIINDPFVVTRRGLYWLRYLDGSLCMLNAFCIICSPELENAYETPEWFFRRLKSVIDKCKVEVYGICTDNPILAREILG